MNAIVEPDTFAKSTPAKSGFRIEQADRLTIEGTLFDWAGQSGDTIFLQPADGQGLTEQFTMGMLSRLSVAGAIKHEVGYYLPDDLKPTPLAKGALFQVSDLNPAQKKRFYSRFFRSCRLWTWCQKGSSFQMW
ncbi:hypothetical protein LZG00_17320 [Rhodobacteraceae bacterium LMO-12]|nr:hypothetical protein [Rhodobacteraceae bacterium LMO-JJ12]